MITLKVAGKKITRFNETSIQLKYDSVSSSFNFVYWYDPNDSELSELNTIGGYASAVLLYNDEVIITGTVLNYSHQETSVKNLSQIAGYSKTGILEDCEIPVSSYPLQSIGKSLADICRAVIRPFNLELIIDPDVSQGASRAISSSTADPKQSIKSYLAEIASQRNIVLSHDNLGRLLLTRAKAKQTPVFFVKSGDFGVNAMSLTFPGQSMHSEITAMKQASADGGNAGQSTVTNPFVEVFRPKTIIIDSGSDNTTIDAANKALANEVSGIVLVISFSSWEFSGVLLKPNIVITVQNEEIGLINKSNWFVEEVTLTSNETSQTAEIKCVLPSSHNGQKPVNIFK